MLAGFDAKPLALGLTSPSGAARVGLRDPTRGFPAIVSNLDDAVANYWTVQRFGASQYPGTRNDTKALQKAFAAGVSLVIPKVKSGNYLFDEWLPVPNPSSIIFEGSLQPLTNGVPDGTPIIPITSSNVTLSGPGGIDGISAAFNKWAGIFASGGTNRLKNIHARKLWMRNLSIDSTAAFAINYDGCDSSTMKDNYLERVGVIGNVLGGGYGLYAQFCRDHQITGNILQYVGSSGINDSAGLGGIITGNSASYSTLFAHKGGYAPNVTTVTADITPTPFTFSVARTANALRNLMGGLGLAVFNPTGLFPIPLASKVVDRGTFLQVYVQNASVNPVPQVGAQVQILLTGTLWSNNRVFMSGDNAWDVNGWYEVFCSYNNINGAGQYSDAGIYAGLADAIWFGYDPQSNPAGGFFNQMFSGRVAIQGNIIENSGGSAIAVMGSASDVLITGNNIGECNRRSFLDGQGFPAGGAIEVHRLAFPRSERATVSDNTIKTTNGFGIWTAYSRDDVLEGNNVTTTDTALMVTSQIGLRVEGGSYTTTLGTGAYGAVLIRDPSGANTNSNIRIRNAKLTVASGYPINNQDANYDATLGNFPNDCSGGEFGVGINDRNQTFIPAGMVSDGRIDEYKATGYATGQQLLMSTALSDQAGFKLHVQLFQFASTFAKGEYEISRGGATIDIYATRAAAGVTVDTSGGLIRVTNSSGGNRQIVAWIAKA